MGGERRTARRGIGALVVVVALSMLFAGCAGGEVYSSVDSEGAAFDSAGSPEGVLPAEAAPEPVEEMAAARAWIGGMDDGGMDDGGMDDGGMDDGGVAHGAEGSASQSLSGVPASPSGRRVITSTLTVATDDVANAAADARDLAVRSGGFVATETTVAGTSGGEQPSATLRLRVPVERAENVVDDLAGLGAEVSREVSSEDVEAQLVDLESRLATARASIARVRDLLDRATDLEDVVLLERELTRRQADYESLAAQQAALSDLAALATVTVTFTTPQDAAAAAGAPGFLGGLDAGWRALVASTAVALTVLGAVLPFALVLGVGVAVVWALVAVRRARARRRSPA